MNNNFGNESIFNSIGIDEMLDILRKQAEGCKIPKEKIRPTVSIVPLWMLEKIEKEGE